MRAVNAQVIAGGRPQADGRIYGRRLYVTEENGAEGSYQITSQGVVKIESAHLFYKFRVTDDNSENTRRLNAARKYCGML